MSAVDSLEKSLGSAFKSAPKLPEGGKKTLVAWLPWINLVLGLLALLSAYTLYHWAHVANSLINQVNSLTQAYGINTGVSASRWSVGIWLGLVVLVVEGLLYVAAFPGTRDRKKAGWNLMFYAVLVNAVYGLVILFTSYGNVGSFIGYLIGTVVGLYLLFQIRSAYSGAGSRSSASS